MEDLQRLRMSELMDLLAFHTSAYTKILSDGGDSEAFEYAKRMIDLIQNEIIRRKQGQFERKDNLPQNFFGSSN